MRQKSWGMCEVFLQGNREVLVGDTQKAPAINKAVQVLLKMEALACDVGLRSSPGSNRTLDF